jgi:hypothetical protein
MKYLPSRRLAKEAEKREGLLSLFNLNLPGGERRWK